MNRFHVNVAVADLERSIEFYATFFGAEPTVRKIDYAKWMLEDPRINFSINQSDRRSGINHVGMQAESRHDLRAIQQRLAHAGQQTFDQPDAECCYARSEKTWVRDPDGVAWESFMTHENITHYGADVEPGELTDDVAETRCCDSEGEAQCCFTS